MLNSSRFAFGTKSAAMMVPSTVPLNMMGPYIDRNLKLAKALIKSMSESIRALQTDATNAKIAIRAALKTDDVETIDDALSRSVRVLDPRPFPTVAGIQTVLDEIGKEAKGKTIKFDDFVDLRASENWRKKVFSSSSAKTD